MLIVIGAFAAITSVAAHEYSELRERQLKDFTVVTPGVLYRARQPMGGQIYYYRQYGIKTVVDLRPESEDPNAFTKQQLRCKTAGVELVNIPVSTVVPSDEQIAQFLRIIRSGRVPVMVHCQYGKTRTGLMAAAYRIVVENWSASDALKEYIDHEGSFHGTDRQPRTELFNRLERDRKTWLIRTDPASDSAKPASSAPAPIN